MLSACLVMLGVKCVSVALGVMAENYSPPPKKKKKRPATQSGRG